MRRMTLRRLEVFVTVVEAGGVRACSDLLDISPAMVSHQVASASTTPDFLVNIRCRFIP